MTYQNNQQVLEQLSYNIDSMNDSIKIFMLTLFQDADNQLLMYNHQTDVENFNFLLQRAFNRLQKTVASNSMISSAAIYNRSANIFYTTHGWKTLDSDEVWKKAIFDKLNDVPLLTPVPVILNDELSDSGREVFTYILYDTKGSDGKAEGALIVNVKTDWLRNNLMKYGGDKGRLYILDDQNRIILDSDQQKTMYTPFDARYLSNIDRNSKTGSSLISGNQVATFFPIQRTNWLMVTEAPYETEFAPLRQMREKTLLYTSICLLGGLLVAFYLAKNIYSPFGNLVNKVRENLLDRLPDAASQKESDLLASAFDYSMRTIGDFDRYKMSTYDILEENRLKSLLMDDKTLDINSGTETKHVPFLMIVFKPDQELYYQELKEEEKRLFYFSITNIADDVLAEISKFKKTAMGNGTFVYLMESDQGVANYRDPTHLEPIRKVQALIGRIIPGITLSAAVSSIIGEGEPLYQVYKNTSSLFDYRIFYGTSCLLQQAMVITRLNRTDLDVPLERTEKLIEAIKSGNSLEAEKIFEDIFDWISQGDCNQLYALLTRLVFLIYREIQHMNAHLIEPIEFKFNSFCYEIVNLTTLEDIHEQFTKLFHRMIEKTTIQTAKKHNYLVNSIVDYIHMEFCSEDLSLKKIASEFKMSPLYVGQIFKDNMDKSVIDYVHQLRLDRVCERLRTTDDSIKNILVDVGYTNETNFYKLFKKHFGITPNEYRQNLTILNKK